MQREVHVGEGAVGAQVARFENRGTRVRGSGEVGGLELAAGHEEGEGGAIQFVGPLRGDAAPVADDRELLADLEDLFELVAHEQGRDSAFLQVEDDAEQRVDLARGERRRRLIHDDELCVAHERAGDRDELLLGDGEATDLLVEIDLEVDLGDGLFGDATHPAPVDELAVGREFAREGEVLEDRKIGEDREVLVDDLHARIDGGHRREALVRRSVDLDGSAVGGVNTGDHLDEGRLAAAVLTGEAVDLSTTDGEADVVEGVNAGERLAHIAYREELSHQRNLSEG